MDQFFVQPVEKKVSSVAWLQQSRVHNEPFLHFYSGTWDHGAHNELALWKCPGPDVRSRQLDSDFEAAPLARVNHSGDVADILVVQHDLCVTASSMGQLHVYKTSDNPGTDNVFLTLTQTLSPNSSTASSPSLSVNAPCVALAGQPLVGSSCDIACVDEAGQLSFFRVDQPRPLAQVHADCLPLYDVTWLSSHTVVTVSRSGQLKLFDRRDPQEPLVVVLDPEAPNAAINCAAGHPSQAHRLATGNELGNILSWDIRKLQEPVSQTVEAHDGEINDILFHPGRPFTIITASEDSSCGVLDLGASAGLQMSHYTTITHPPVRKLQNLYNCLPINTLDYHVSANILLAGSDSTNLLFQIE
ncbi:Nucleoporin Nup43 [Dispira simplex]|nr:Nucleoporin Nup43 [Dispira simplex]